MIFIDLVYSYSRYSYYNLYEIISKQQFLFYTFQQNDQYISDTFKCDVKCFSTIRPIKN